MGLLDVLKDHVEVDVSKKRILEGECVLQVESAGVREGKEGKRYVFLKANVINIVKQKDGASPLFYGNRFEIFFDETQEKKLKKLSDNLFTAGLPLDKSSEEAAVASLAALENKLIYAYLSKGKFKPEDKDEEIEFQTYKFFPAKKLTPENSMPQIPI